MTRVLTRDCFPYAFRILGPLDGPRKRVSADAAAEAYRNCDPRASVADEGYLSHFRFDESFRDHLMETGSTRGFTGPTWAEELIFDIDSEGNLAAALEGTRKLIKLFVGTFAVRPHVINVFFSGSKGFHVALPTVLWRPHGGLLFHRVAGVFARRLAAQAGVAIDTGIYDRVRAVRAPNSRHPKSGLHKRQIPVKALETISVASILEQAREPYPFEVLERWLPLEGDRLNAEWQLAGEAVREEERVAAQRRDDLARGVIKPSLNRLTLEIIRGEPIKVGDRHRLIYAAARDLAEKGAPKHLIDVLLRDVALDSGLPPREVERQLACGFNDASLMVTTSVSEATTPDEYTHEETS